MRHPPTSYPSYPLFHLTQLFQLSAELVHGCQIVIFKSLSDSRFQLLLSSVGLQVCRIEIPVIDHLSEFSGSHPPYSIILDKQYKVRASGRQIEVMRHHQHSSLVVCDRLFQRGLKIGRAHV